MPTYEFRCPDGHTFDRFYRKMSDAVFEVPCPECGKVAVRQMAAGAGLSFKGSGFYLTDYGKNAHRTSGSGPSSQDKSEKSSSEGAGGGSDAKSSPSESKPAETKSSESKPSETKSSDTKPSSGTSTSSTKTDK